MFCGKDIASRLPGPFQTPDEAAPKGCDPGLDRLGRVRRGTRSSGTGEVSVPDDLRDLAADRIPILGRVDDLDAAGSRAPGV